MVTARELILALPNKVRVGAHDVSIKINEGGTDAWGSFTAVDFLIEIEPNMPSTSKVAEVVLHEIGHAICWIYALGEKGFKEEEWVTKYTMAWTQVYRDNPWLASWISWALGHAARPTGVSRHSGKRQAAREASASVRRKPQRLSRAG